MLEDVRHERSLILLLSLTDPDILRQSSFTDHEICFMKILPLENLHRQQKEYLKSKWVLLYLNQNWNSFFC